MARRRCGGPWPASGNDVILFSPVPPPKARRQTPPCHALAVHDRTRRLCPMNGKHSGQTNVTARNYYKVGSKLPGNVLRNSAFCLKGECQGFGNPAGPPAVGAGG